MKYKQWTILSLLVISSLVLGGCARSPGTPLAGNMQVAVAQSDKQRVLAPQAPQAALAELADGNSEFAFDLFHAVQGEDGNLIYSPISLSTALAMTYAGARGDTETQMRETLHFSLPQDGLHPAFNALDIILNAPAQAGEETSAFQLHTVNSLWGQVDFAYVQDFLDLIAENYGAGVRLVDFINEEHREQARLAINQWVSDQTQGKIQDLIAKGILTELTRLVLANAVYFKADWESPFLNGTKDGDFHLLDGSLVTVPMMARRAQTPYVQAADYQAVSLPYQGGRAEMIVILPDDGQFEAVQEAFSDELINQIMVGLEQTDVKLYLPRFEYETSLDLSKTLAEMGMPDAFEVGKADFTGTVANSKGLLFIKYVLHKAFIHVDEMGTEAAAATGVIEEMVSEPVEVRVDRPFLFVIRDAQTNTFMFIGRVLNPGS